MTGISRRALLRRFLPRPTAPEPEPEPRFLVRVDRDRCITFKGPECGACAGLCPENEHALRMRRFRPEFAAESCSGCGRCVLACPVIPSALALAEQAPPAPEPAPESSGPQELQSVPDVPGVPEALPGAGDAGASEA